MKNEDVNKKTAHKGQDSYFACFMCIGMSVGMLIGQMVFDNMALGMGIGMSIGVAIGAALDAEKRKSSDTGENTEIDTQDCNE